MRISMIRTLLHLAVALTILGFLIGWVDQPELSSDDIEAVLETSSLHSDEWGAWCAEIVDGSDVNDECPREGALGGCFVEDSDHRGFGTIYWEYAGPSDYTTTDVMFDCKNSGGAFLAP